MIKGLSKIYRIFGFYMYGGKQNNFTGRFSIHCNGVIYGKILDSNSIFSEHQVEGKVNFVKIKVSDIEKITMNFVKIPTGLLINIYYSLVKETEPFNELTGDYRGYWNFKEKVIPIVPGTEGETENSSRIFLKEEK